MGVEGATARRELGGDLLRCAGIRVTRGRLQAADNPELKSALLLLIQDHMESLQLTATLTSVINQGHQLSLASFDEGACFVSPIHWRWLQCHAN